MYDPQVHWLRRLFTRERDPEPRRIEELLELGERVELIGRVEPLTLLHDPIHHKPAVVIRYQGRPIARVDQQTPFAELPNSVDIHQAAAFVLRDPSGAARIEIDTGVDLRAVHERLLGDHGAAFKAEVELIGPGDEVRVQGRVSQRSDGGSPHRRELAWSVVVVAESVTLIE